MGKLNEVGRSCLWGEVACMVCECVTAPATRPTGNAFGLSTRTFGFFSSSAIVVMCALLLHRDDLSKTIDHCAADGTATY